MSFEILTNFVDQFSANWQMLSQQQGTKLRASVTEKPGVTGKRFDQNQIGSSEAEKNTTRHGDTPIMHTPHSRRWGNMYDYDWADLVDSLDKVKMLDDPTSEYAISGAWAMGRAMDDEIIAALGGTSYSGETGSSSVALPAEQIISHGSTGLTLAKLHTINEKFNSADVMMAPGDQKTIVCAPQQITNLLNEEKLTSADYQMVKALVAGQIDTALGFKFIMSNRLTKTSTTRKCYAYVKSGVVLGIGANPETDIGPRRDKRNSTQVYIKMSIGATRLEEEKVIEVECTES